MLTFKSQPTQLENGSFICECAYAGYKPNDIGDMELDVSSQDENAKCILVTLAADATLNFNNQSDRVSIESKATRKLALGFPSKYPNVK